MKEKKQEKNFIIDEPNCAQRLDIFLQKEFKDFSRSHIKKWLVDGNVKVNENKQKSGYSLRVGDRINVIIPQVQECKAVAENIQLDIVYEDKDLAVINKPQGMVVHAGNGNYSGTLVNALLFQIKDLSGINGVLRPGIVHRLDKNTSGLLLIAKNDFAHNELAKQIQEKSCKRQYLAILEGNLKDDAGTIKTGITRNKKQRTLMSICDETEGKIAITEYKVLERFPSNCLVEFNLKTGRTHQIRVHCKEFLHHIIVGDLEYGGKPAKQIFKSEPQSLGQYLVAYKISFVHPTTKKEMNFEIPLPDYFQCLLEKLRKENI